jgi:hypothetical protein
MESHKQLRIQQEEIRLTRLANAALSRDNDAIRAQLGSFQGSLDRVTGEKLELKAQATSRTTRERCPCVCGVGCYIRVQIEERDLQFASIRQLLQSEQDARIQLQDDATGWWEQQINQKCGFDFNSEPLFSAAASQRAAGAPAAGQPGRCGV